MRLILASAAFLGLVTPAIARPALSVDVVSPSAAETTLDVRIDPSQLQLAKRTWGGRTFTALKLPEAGLPDGTPGTPDLPVLRRLVAVDPGRRYEIRVTMAGRLTMHDVTLAPVLRDVPDDGRPRPLALDESAYREDRVLGVRAVTLGRRQAFGPLTLRAVDVRPFHYNPARRELIVWRHVTVQLRALPPAAKAAPKRVARTPRLAAAGRRLTPFQAAQVRALVANAPLVLATMPRVATPRLLVLTTADLAAAAGGLTAGGRLAGWNVDVQTVAAGATSQALKDVISAAYAKGDLSSVLLFGDPSRLPLYSWDTSTPGDWWYALLDQGSNYASVGLGRLPVTSADMASTVFARLTAYDQRQRTGYVDPRVLLIAHAEDYPGSYTAEQETIRQRPDLAGLRFTTAYGGAGATNATVVSAWDAGTALVSYRGHGDDPDWYDWGKDGLSFTADHVHSLTNDVSGLPVVLSIACDTGAVQDPKPSLAEEMLFYRGTDGPVHGAVAVIAATVASYTDVNARFNGYFFDELASGPVPDLGTFLAVANNRLVRDNGGAMLPNVEMYLLIGDPTLRPWLPTLQ